MPERGQHYDSAPPYAAHPVCPRCKLPAQDAALYHLSNYGHEARLCLPCLKFVIQQLEGVWPPMRGERLGRLLAGRQESEAGD